MARKIPLLDLVAQYHSIQSEVDSAIRRVMESGLCILGSEVVALEQEVAEYIGVQYAIGVASGTDALILTLRALDIGPGDEVIVPAYTFFATVGAVLHVGAKPVFVDIDSDTYCLNVGKITKTITSRTKAIIPVHLFGHPVDMNSLMQIARIHGLKVVEDNAQAFGAAYNGQRTGSFGDVACLSFFPTKNLAGYGDGGMVVTNDCEIAERIRMLRTHGWKRKYYPELLGYNSRLDSLQAAILRVKLRHVDEWNIRRRQIAEQYSDRLSHLDIVVPYASPDVYHVYHLYVVRVTGRDKLRQTLNDFGIASDVYYPQPPYMAEVCRHLGHRPSDFPVSEQASRELLAVPLYPEVNQEDMDLVVAALKKATKDKGFSQK
jgi:dTDP-4-amino-4,6-dideoxygalactose transaminase